MAKFQKVPNCPGLYLNTESRVYYVRKSVGGEQITKTTRHTNQHLAKKEMERILAWYYRSNDPRTKGKALFRDIALKQLDLYHAQAEATFNNFEVHYRLYLEPYFGDMEIGDVARQWKDYVALQKRKNPKRKLGHDRRHVRKILGLAEEMGFIDAVPKLDLARSETKAAPGRELSNREIKAALLAANKKLALMFKIKLHTGMRDIEVRSMEWINVDFERQEIYVPQAKDKNREGKFYGVSSEILQDLSSHRSSQKIKSPYVFPKRGNPMEHMVRSDKPFQRLKKKLGLNIKGHWTRHTAATRMVRAGASPLLVQKTLGMSDQTMKQVYLHVSDEDRQKMASAVAESMKHG